MKPSVCARGAGLVNDWNRTKVARIFEVVQVMVAEQV
jgi:hypothetical protein